MTEQRRDQPRKQENQVVPQRQLPQPGIPEHYQQRVVFGDGGLIGEPHEHSPPEPPARVDSRTFFACPPSSSAVQPASCCYFRTNCGGPPAGPAAELPTRRRSLRRNMLPCRSTTSGTRGNRFVGPGWTCWNGHPVAKRR